MSSIESITQIPGIYAAHATNAEAGTGCTVIICPKGATGGVDVRGGAPATGAKPGEAYIARYMRNRVVTRAIRPCIRAIQGYFIAFFIPSG